MYYHYNNINSLITALSFPSPLLSSSQSLTSISCPYPLLSTSLSPSLSPSFTSIILLYRLIPKLSFPFLFPLTYIYKLQLYISSYIYNYKLSINKRDKYNCIKAYKYNNIILQADYSMNDNDIKIEYLNINNDYYSNKFNELKILTNDECFLLKNAIFNYIEHDAYKNSKNKIIIDIHSNLERYNNELKDLGFINTNRKCLDNSFWYEAEKILK
jgi:hypothetical protein